MKTMMLPLIGLALLIAAVSVAMAVGGTKTADTTTVSPCCCTMAEGVCAENGAGSEACACACPECACEECACEKGACEACACEAACTGTECTNACAAKEENTESCNGGMCSLKDGCSR